MKAHHVRLLGLVGFIATVSILANFGLELATEKFPQLGLARFTTFAHGSQGGN
jgi:hypothetical protein